ncbi:unnamed protein product [Symbiodinium microadriaticum]|nr:unnamed protein product [Symbiodinium microadriaticum]
MAQPRLIYMFDMANLVVLLVGGLIPLGMSAACVPCLQKFGTNATRCHLQGGTHDEHLEMTIPHDTSEDAPAAPIGVHYYATTTERTQAEGHDPEGPLRGDPVQHFRGNIQYTIREYWDVVNLTENTSEAYESITNRPQHGEHDPDELEPGRRVQYLREPAHYTNQYYEQGIIQPAGHDSVEPGPDRREQYHREPTHDMNQHYENAEAAGLPQKETHRDGEVVTLMQTMPRNNAWYAFLQALRGKLEEATCTEKIQMAGDLLRLVHWHCTNAADGYLLGHMGGMTGEITALLVVALGSGDYEEGATMTATTAGAWAEAERFLEQHAGSPRTRGRRIGDQPPCIMNIHKPVPTATPNTSHGSDTEHGGTSNKKRCLEVKIYERGTTRRGALLNIPMTGSTVSLGLDLRVTEGGDAAADDTADASCHAGTEIERVHGKEAVRMLMERWFGEEGLLLYAQTDEEEGLGHEVKAPLNEEDKPKETEEPDETSHLGLTLVLHSTIAMATRDGLAREYEAIEVRISRDQLGRLRREGWTQQEQSSALYVRVQARNDGDYSDRFPEMMEELDLPVDVNLSPACLPAACPVLTWIEAEMWDRFVDWFEGEIGAVSVEGLGADHGNRRETHYQEQVTTTRRTTHLFGDYEYLGNSGGCSLLDAHGGAGTQLGGSFERWQAQSTKAKDAQNEREIQRRQMGTTNGQHKGRKGATTSNRGNEAIGHSRATSSWEDSGPSGAASGAIRSDECEIDIVQATTRWLRLMGLRGPGEYSLEPSNAILKSRQRTMRRELGVMGDANLAVMYRGLMRLMGMLFIECARILMQVQDDRLRAHETVDVEVDADEDEESIYMQTRLTSQSTTWTNLLQQLINMADTDMQRHRGLLGGLHRRIRDSLYLSTTKGSQLEATLIATGCNEESSVVEACDTEDNDSEMVEKWWSKLKHHMDLGNADSDSQGCLATTSGALAIPEHSAAEIERWENERQSLAVEDSEDEQLRARAKEEEDQDKADEMLYQSHVSARLRDWEAWVVLNTPNTVKRRRLNIAVQPGMPLAPNQGQMVETTSVEIPSGSSDFHVVMFTSLTEEPVQQSDEQAPSGGTGAPSGDNLDINGGVFDRAFEAWKEGRLSDELVHSIFGEDWLFLFGVTKHGVEDDTMPPPPRVLVRISIEEWVYQEHRVCQQNLWRHNLTTAEYYLEGLVLDIGSTLWWKGIWCWTLMSRRAVITKVSIGEWMTEMEMALGRDAEDYSPYAAGSSPSYRRQD